MSYLSKYVGKFLYDLYHGMGINSATLTGAIDVIIIEQEDGTFTCSPFHVRFGKLGVLRAREKIVDLEINGVPVDLHMKLGEAGEAFFVQELAPESQIPAYLATSPLPASEDLMRQGVKELHRQSNLETSPQRSALTAQIDSHEKTSKDDISTTISHDPISATDPLGQYSPNTDFNISVENAPAKHRRRKKRVSLRTATHAGKLSSSTGNVSSEIFEMDDTTDEDDIPDRRYSSSTPMATLTGPPTFEECRMTRTQSWAQTQFDVTTHAFSDSEVMSELSPPSRPLSPVSDSEVERYRNNERADIDENTLWEWGDLPKTPVARDKILAGMKDPHSAHNGVVSKNQKHGPKSQRQLPKEGLYLDDLMNEEMDPEIAKLYFPKSTAQFQSIRERDEDTESGRGASLPQSPHSVEGAIGGPPGSYLKSQVDNLGPVSMSLCGGLPDGGPTPERFMLKIVTYDELSANPALVTNPDLVLRIDDKYYNWETATPMLLSQSVFQKDLPLDTIQSLVKDHMPKKRRTGMSSWFSWRRTVADDRTSTDVLPVVAATMDTQQDVAAAMAQESGRAKLEISQVQSAPSSLSSSPRKERPISAQRPLLGYEETMASDADTDSSDKGGTIHVAEDGRVYQKTLRLSSDQIKDLGLKPGQNTATFSVTTQYQGTTRCMAQIYLWSHRDKIVISDIDGTITKSDVLGQILPILPIVGRDWSQSGVAELYTKIHRNGYKLVYLSARAIGQSQITKDLLKSIKQDNVVLPEGPILLSPTSLIRAFHREVIEKKPEGFKIHCLSDIGDLFPPNMQPFYAGFGNKINDVYAYKALDIAPSHIFTINYSGQLRQEKILTFQSSYHDMCDTVDHFFPPLPPVPDRSHVRIARRFSSTEFWRDPLPEISDLDSTGAASDDSQPAVGAIDPAGVIG